MTEIHVVTKSIPEQGFELPWEYLYPGCKAEPRSGTAWIPLDLIERLSEISSTDASFGGPELNTYINIGFDQERALLAIGWIGKATRGNAYAKQPLLDWWKTYLEKLRRE